MGPSQRRRLIRENQRLRAATAKAERDAQAELIAISEQERVLHEFAATPRKKTRTDTAIERLHTGLRDSMRPRPASKQVRPGTRDTDIERRVQGLLRELGVPFRKHTRFGRYEADIYIASRKLVIECDGEYWHQHWDAKTRDARKDAHLARCGLRVLRIPRQAMPCD